MSEDRWDCLLKVGYQEVFLNKKSKTIELLRDRQGTNSKWESMFAVLKNQIIAVGMRYKSVAKEDDKQNLGRVLSKCMTRNLDTNIIHFLM